MADKGHRNAGKEQKRNGKTQASPSLRLELYKQGKPYREAVKKPQKEKKPQPVG